MKSRFESKEDATRYLSDKGFIYSRKGTWRNGSAQATIRDISDKTNIYFVSYFVEHTPARYE